MIDNPRAHNNRGVAYSTGLGATRDYVRAFMWFSLAAAGGIEHGAENRDFAAKQLNPAQFAEAQNLVRAWTETHQKK